MDNPDKSLGWVNELKAWQAPGGHWVCDIRTTLGELLFTAYGNDAKTAESRAI
jgi:hypothetical protein